jgi:hypothetical protein
LSPLLFSTQGRKDARTQGTSVDQLHRTVNRFPLSWRCESQAAHFAHAPAKRFPLCVFASLRLCVKSFAEPSTLIRGVFEPVDDAMNAVFDETFAEVYDEAEFHARQP